MIQFIKSTQSTYDSLLKKDIDALYFIEPSYNTDNIMISPGRIYRGDILLAESNDMLNSTIATLTAGILELSATYGVCDTLGSISNKIVKCDYFRLREGIKITVKFSEDNTSAMPTLNVNNTGAKYITSKGDFITPSLLERDRLYDFVYDGMNYELVSGGGVVGNGSMPDSFTDSSVDVVLTNGNKTYLLGTQKTPSAEAQSTTAVADSEIYIEADGTLIAKLFKGELQGIATKALTDVNDNPIADTYAPLESPIFKGNPTAPTKDTSDNSDAIATTAFVQTIIQNGLTGVVDGLIFKGGLEGEFIDETNKYGALTPAATLGDFYKVTYEGYINGVKVEVGDVLICAVESVVDATPTNYRNVKDKWLILQNNLDLATEETPGIISAEMFSKIKNLSLNAEENQNAFSTIYVNDKNNVVAANAKEGSFALVAGQGISLSTNINGDTITISSTGGTGGGNGEVYTFTAQSDGDNAVKLKLTDSSNRTQLVNIKGTGGASLSVDESGSVLIHVSMDEVEGALTETKNIISSNPTDTENGASSGGVYINHINGTEVISSHGIFGIEGINVLSDEDGNITINATELKNALSWKELKS